MKGRLIPIPDWVPGRVLYQLHALAAAGAPPVNPDVTAPQPCGRGLQVLQGWLDRVGALGCGGVLLTPVFVSSTHGYDTVDALRIDQRLGDDDDFAAFVDACHRRDLKVILDGVFNHVGRGFPAFVDVLQHRDRSGYADWFRLDFAPGGSAGDAGQVGDAGNAERDGFTYARFEGHRDLVALNHDNPAVLDWASGVTRHWLDRGADGWRLDAAYAIPAPFISALVARTRSHHPAAFLFGEVIHGDYSRFVADTGLDSVTQYELYKAIWSSLNDANLFELAWALKRHQGLAATFAPVTFAGNHDVTRLASQLHDPAHLGAALAILFTVPGVACVYYGDKLAWEGVKEHRPGGDDAIRPRLPLHPDQLAAVPALELHRRLIAVRRARPWLTRADVEVLALDNRHMTYTVTAAEGAMLVALDADHSEPAPPPGWRAVATGPGFTIAERYPPGEAG